MKRSPRNVLKIIISTGWLLMLLVVLWFLVFIPLYLFSFDRLDDNLPVVLLWLLSLVAACSVTYKALRKLIATAKTRR